MLIKLNTAAPMSFAPSQTGLKPYVLMPMVNDLPDAVWAALKDRPQVKKYLEDGVLEVVSEKTPTGKAADPEAAADLAAMSVDDAVAVVKLTFNKELLEKWADSEERKKVANAIQKQLKELVGEKPKE